MATNQERLLDWPVLSDDICEDCSASCIAYTVWS